VPRLCEIYPGICLTTEEKARKNLSQGKKNLSQVKENFRRSTVYILPKYPHITNPLTNTHTHTLQNNIKPSQYKLKQTQCKKYPNEIFTKVKGKAMPLQAWRGPNGSRRLRLPHLKTIGT
jgi:hypothetical protein